MISSGINDLPGIQHKKHANTDRPSTGNFGRNEWAFVGGQCNLIKALTNQVISALSLQYKCAYIDSTHDDVPLIPEKIASGATLELTDHISYKQLNYKSFNKFEEKQLFNNHDVVFINGNHQQAKAQVVIISDSKRQSLFKRLDQLKNIKLFLLADDAEEVFDFIKVTIPTWRQIPIYKTSEIEKIIDFFRKEILANVPVLNGLVLAGGKSLRMGTDKGTINWHGKAQKYRLADMLKPFCSEVYISCREEQAVETEPGYAYLPDTFKELGPMGAILSAFRKKPDNAWLVIACDLPLLEASSISYLIDNRTTFADATTYKSPINNFPEPLITIWEPKSYATLLLALSQGYSCPRKVLINSDTHIIDAPYPEQLTNVNTPDELNRVKRLLHQKSAAG